MVDKWPTLGEQLNAVLSAPIPFFFAVVIIAWAAWGAWRWRFKAVFEKQKELYDLSRSEVDHWKNNAELTAKELADKIDLLEKQQNLTAETKEQLGLARQSLLRLNAQLNNLGQANSSPTGPTGPSGTQQLGIWRTPPGPTGTIMDWTSHGWKPRKD